MAFFNLDQGIYPDKETQIASLFTKNVKILDKYSDFANVFLEAKVLELPERTKLNKHAINPKYSKQLSYGPIYSLEFSRTRNLKNLH